MVMGVTSLSHVQQHQALLSSRFSSGLRPIQLSPYKRSSASRLLRVAQSFDTQPAAAAPPEPVTERIEPAAAEPLVEDDHQQQTPVPRDVLSEFEHKLEADLQSVAVTLTAVTGVIIFWRGVWSLLDTLMGDSLLGDICCIIVGLTVVLGIRLSGVKVASSFWPPS